MKRQAHYMCTTCIVFCFNFFRGCSSYTRVKKALSESFTGVAANKEPRDEAGVWVQGPVYSSVLLFTFLVLFLRQTSRQDILCLGNEY